MRVFFYLFLAWLFGGYDGCDSGNGTWIGVVVLVGVVEVFYSVTMGVGSRGRSMASGGGDASVADGGGAKYRYCCRFSDGILGELQEDLPYRLPFTLNVIDFFS